MPRKTKAALEAGMKRSIARRFNDALQGRSAATKPTDKRVERKLTRYRNELKKGVARGKSLTPLDVAMRVHELLENGEKLTELRKLVKPKPGNYDQDQMADLLREMHPVYGYRAEAYRFAGVNDATLLSAGIIDKVPAKRGPKPKKDSKPKPKPKARKRK